MAVFRIDQATPGAGIAGRSRHDLISGEVITLVATSPAGVGVTYTWEILDKVGSQAVLSSTTGTSVTIGPALNVTEPCAFLVKLTANDNGVITEDARIASVRTAVAGLRVPLFPESAPTTNRLDANDPSLSADNATYPNRAGLGASGQNWRGWAEWAWEITQAVEAAGGGAGINQLTGDATAGPGSGAQAITVTQARGLRETAGPTTLAMGAVADGEYLRRSGATVVGGTPSAGINQLTGDATAGPGSGAQAVTVAQARGLRETAGPTTLTMGAVADGEYLRRSGTTVVGGTPTGGGSNGVYIFQPGGTPSGNLYDNFGTLYTAASADTAPITVLLDDSLATVEIPAATYDFDGWTFKARGLSPVTLTMMDGALVPYAGTNAVKIRFEDVNVAADPGGLTQSVFYDNGGGSSPTLDLTLVNSSMIGDAANTVALIDVSPLAMGANVNFTLVDSTVNEWTVEGDNASATVGMTVTGYGYSFLADSALQGTATNFNLVQRTTFGSLSRSPNLTATTSSFDNTGGDRVRLTWNESQTGTSEASIGMIYLLEGTVIPTANVMIGALAGGTDSATLRLRRFTGGTLIETWTVTGPLAEATLAAAIEITASDWYEFTLAAGGVAQTALAKGAFLNMYAANLQPPA